MSRFQTVLFDLDGTLLDHFAAIHKCHKHTMTRLGLPAPTMDDVRRAIGGGLEEAVRRLFGETHAHLVAEAVPIYRAFWAENMLYGVALLPGSMELVEALTARGIQCAVFTNKHGPSARTVLKHLEIDHLMKGIFGATDTPWLKPEPEFSTHALTTLRSHAAVTCLIGDSPYDIEAGKNGGFPCYCVTTGTHTPEELTAAGAAGVYKDMYEVAREVFGLSL